MKNKNPNILFLMTDHQRADSIGMSQSGLEITPNLNRLAAKSIFFSHAYNSCPLCVPARTSLATGKYPTANGIVFNDWNGLRAGNHKPIHQYLAEAGYDVGHVGVHHIRIKPTLRKRVKFVKWIDENDYKNYLATHDINFNFSSETTFKSEVTELQENKYVKEKYSNTKTAVWPYPDKLFKDNYFCQQSIDFIKQQRKKPFALFVYLWAPHPPLILPEPYASKFIPENIKLPPNIGIPAKGEPPCYRKSVPAQLAEGLSVSEWRKVWAAHLGLVNLADTGIGRILKALKTSNYEDDTIIVFTTDHGDNLGQHKMYQKMEMYEQSIRVPVIFHIPDIKPQRFDNLVSHMDILPTLLELTGCKIPKDVDGVSLVESIITGNFPKDRYIFCQYSGNPKAGDIRRTVITRKYKYVYNPSGLHELYNLLDDPQETTNLATESNYSKIIKKLLKECKTWAETHNDWVKF
jgi:choline-sulfatase